MKKAFLSNIVFLVLINLLIKPLYLFGIDAQVQNQVGANEYGLYFALFNFVFLFQFFLDPGIQNYNSTKLSKNRDKVNHIFPSVFGTKLILVNVFIVFALVGGYLFYPASHLKYLILIIIIQILSSFYLYFRSHFSALGEYRKDVYFSALDKLIMIFFIGYILFFDQITIYKFLVAQILSFSVALLVIILFLRNHLNFKINFSGFRRNLKSAIPFGLVFILMTLYTRMDGVMLESLLDDDAYQAGIYAAAYRLLDAVNIIAILFASLLLPMFSNIIKDKTEIYKLSQLALQLILVIASITILCVWFYHKELLHLIYTNLNEAYYNTFKILIISFFAYSISYIYGTLITASAELKIFNLIFIVGIIINWTLNLIYIPKFGALGAAWTTVITQFFVMIAQTILAHYKFQLSVNFKLILQFSLLSIFGFLVFHYTHEYVQLSWIITMTFSIILFLILSILMGFIRLNWVFGMAFEE